MLTMMQILGCFKLYKELFIVYNRVLVYNCRESLSSSELLRRVALAFALHSLAPTAREAGKPTIKNS